LSSFFFLFLFLLPSNNISTFFPLLLSSQERENIYRDLGRRKRQNFCLFSPPLFRKRGTSTSAFSPPFTSVPRGPRAQFGAGNPFFFSPFSLKLAQSNPGRTSFPPYFLFIRFNLVAGLRNHSRTLFFLVPKSCSRGFSFLFDSTRPLFNIFLWNMLSPIFLFWPAPRSQQWDVVSQLKPSLFFFFLSMKGQLPFPFRGF